VGRHAVGTGLIGLVGLVDYGPAGARLFAFHLSPFSFYSSTHKYGINNQQTESRNLTGRLRLSTSASVTSRPAWAARSK
jgi:hypothetical protein